MLSEGAWHVFDQNDLLAGGNGNTAGNTMLSLLQLTDGPIIADISDPSIYITDQTKPADATYSKITDYESITLTGMLDPSTDGTYEKVSITKFEKPSGGAYTPGANPNCIRYIDNRWVLTDYSGVLLQEISTDADVLNSIPNLTTSAVEAPSWDMTEYSDGDVVDGYTINFGSGFSNFKIGKIPGTLNVAYISWERNGVLTSFEMSAWGINNENTQGGGWGLSPSNPDRVGTIFGRLGNQTGNYGANQQGTAVPFPATSGFLTAAGQTFWYRASTSSSMEEMISVVAVVVDADGDGIPAASAPDDNDPNVTGVDSDGDGVDDAIDPDPSDALNTGVDFDGDGVDAAVDTDDNDPYVTGVDLGEDGVDDAIDPDPNDPNSTGFDSDNDGYDAAIDLDDNDPDVTVDMDGDGVDATIDTDDSNALAGADMDLDGVDENLDMDDNDPNVGADNDQDGVDSFVDIDDNDPYVTGIDADNDGYDKAVDDDDNDPNVTEDYDGDGVDASIDVDDYDPNIQTGDADGDGYDASIDDDDNDPNITVDMDGDGVDATIDTDDNDPTTTGIDSDGDGYDDAIDSDPNDPTVSGDDDGDGIDNIDEDAMGTDRNNPDTDGDGINDNVDTAPLDPSLGGDSDGDGIDDLFDMNPYNPDVNVSIGSVSLGNASLYTYDPNSDLDAEIDPSLISATTLSDTSSIITNDGKLNLGTSGTTINLLSIFPDGILTSVQTPPALQDTDGNDLGVGNGKNLTGSNLTVVVVGKPFAIINSDGSFTAYDADADGIQITVPPGATLIVGNGGLTPGLTSGTTVNDGSGLSGVDTDGDGVPDIIDLAPNDSSISLPTGVDADGDGVDDSIDSDPTDPNVSGVDTDGDGVDDAIDGDIYDPTISARNILGKIGQKVGTELKDLKSTVSGDITTSSNTINTRIDNVVASLGSQIGNINLNEITGGLNVTQADGTGVHPISLGISTDGNVSIGGTLKVVKRLTALGEIHALRAETTGSATVGTDLSVSGASGLNTLSVSGHADFATVSLGGHLDAQSATFLGKVRAAELEVSGTTKIVNTTTVEVSDNILELNKSSDSSTTGTISGVEINRGGSADKAKFLWDNAGDQQLFKFMVGDNMANLSANKLSVPNGSGIVINNVDLGDYADFSNALTTAKQ